MQWILSIEDEGGELVRQQGGFVVDLTRNEKQTEVRMFSETQD